MRAADRTAPPPASPAEPADPVRGRRRADRATLLALVAGLGLVVAAVAAGGSMTAFADGPSLLIVFGGTLAAVAVCFSPREVGQTFALLRATLGRPAPDPSGAAIRALELAEAARRHGLLHLDQLLGAATTSAFQRKAMAMVVDGALPDELEEVLHHDLQATLHRHRRSAAVLRRAADYAPAMGLIGTLIGLVQMLGNLDQPSRVGPGMAVALLTTLYGAVLANLVFSPLATRLERNAVDEELVCHVFLLAALSISRQENPRRLELLLNSVLPPAARVRYFD